MTNHIRLLIAAVLALSIGSTYAQKFILEYFTSFPSYTEVVEHFYTSYDNPESNPTIKLEFAKKPEGRYVVRHDYINKSFKQEECLWKKGSFQKLKYYRKEQRNNSAPTETNSSSKEALSYLQKRDFKRHPFFGYPDWAEDVVYHFEPIVHKLNDTLIYGLARAYGALSVNFTTNQFATKAGTEIMFNSGGNCISEEQKIKLITLNRNAIKYYRMVDSINPDYCVVVGRMNTKLSNEYVDLFYKLWPLTNIDEAQSYLVPGLYTDNMISYAKNYLNSC